jgi:phage protein U
MADVLMALGPFRFATETAAYQTLKRKNDYRWPVQSRLADRPTRQFVGVGEEAVDIPGIVYPNLAGGLGQIEQLREMSGRGVPMILADGLGFVWGRYVVLSLQEERSFLLPDGRPRKQTFVLQLSHYGEG